MSKLRWISSSGGPLILMEMKFLDQWLGSYLPADEYNSAEVKTPRGDYYLCIDSDLSGRETDYVRACSVESSAALLDVGSVKGLVLADENHRTSWWPMGRGGVLVRQVCSDSERHVINDLRRLPGAKPVWQQVGTWTLTTPHLLLFDALDLGIKRDSEALQITIKQGTYSVQTCLNFGLTKGTSLLLHKLEKTG